jgi:hypothetical protein
MQDNIKRSLIIHQIGPHKDRGYSVIATTYSDESIEIRKLYYAR